jgi:hypothetical protein
LANLILAVECWVLFRLLKWKPPHPPGQGETESREAPPVKSDGGEDEEGSPDNARSDWRLSFLFIGVAFLLGIPKHGLVGVLPPRVLTVVVYASALAGGFGILFAEWASILTWCRSRERQFRWILTSYLKVAVFGTVLAFTLNLTTVIVNAALGLVPIMVLEGMAGFRGNRDGWWMAGGLALSAMAAPIYLMELEFHPWSIPDYFAHAIMMVTLWMVWWGIKGRFRNPSKP